MGELSEGGRGTGRTHVLNIKDQTGQGRTEGRKKVTEEMRDGKPQDHIPNFFPFWHVNIHFTEISVACLAFPISILCPFLPIIN